MTLQNPSVNASGTVTVGGNMEVNSRQTATATIQNNGTFFNQVVFLLVNGIPQGGRHLEIAPGETANLDMSFTPVETGEHTIAIALKSFKAQNSKVTSEYNDCIQVRVLKNSDGGNTYWNTQVIEIPVQLGKLKTGTYDVEVPLEVDGYYWFNISYKTNGYYLGNTDLWDSHNLNLVPFKVEIPEPTDEVLGVGTVSNTKTPSIVYDLQGRPTDNRKVKKGLYIVNGKKIIKR